MNAKDEFLKTTKLEVVLAAEIIIAPDYNDLEAAVCAKLYPGFNDKEAAEFLKAIDVEYDDGYGLQQLYGTIWCGDGVWYTRYEYDGSESWDEHRYPELPTRPE